MSPARRKGNKGRRPQGAAKPNDMWRAVPSLDPPEPIIPARDPKTLLHSLGDPPLPGQGQVAEHYLAAVVEEAAKVATALAAASGLLGVPDAD